MKNITLLLSFTLSTLLFSGCTANKNSNLNYVGVQKTDKTTAEERFFYEIKNEINNYGQNTYFVPSDAPEDELFIYKQLMINNL